MGNVDPALEGFPSTTCMGLVGLASKYLVPGSSISSSSDNKKRNRQQSRRKRKDYAGVRSVRVCRSFRVRECQNAMAASNGPGAFAHQPAHGEKPQPWGLLGLLKQYPTSLPIGCLASSPDSSIGGASFIPCQYVRIVCQPHSQIHVYFLLNTRDSPMSKSSLKTYKASPFAHRRDLSCLL